MNVFWLSLFWGVVTFFIFGQIVAIRTISLNKLELSFLKYVWFCLFMAICYLYQGIFYGIGLIIIGIGLTKLLGASRANILTLYGGISFLIVSYFFINWYVTKKENLKIALSVIVTCIIVFLARSILVKIDNLGSFWYLLLFFPILLGKIRDVFSPNKKKEKSETKQAKQEPLPEPYKVDKKLIFLGIDGCDPKLLNEFIKEGRLPNLKRLIEEGTYCKTKSIYPTDSPLIWNSIFTGKTPQEHGIDFWYKTKFPGLSPLAKQLFYPKGSRVGKIIKWLIKKNIVRRIPYSTNDRKVKALWNVLTDFNKKSVNIGWIYSWPAEEINGVQVSWYMYPFEEAAQDSKKHKSSVLKKRVYPEGLTKDLEKLIVREKEISDQERKKMYFTTAKLDPNKKFTDKLSIWDYAKDKTFLNIAHYFLDKEKKFNFFSLYLFGIDSVCHSYWPFMPQAINKEKYKNEVLSVSDSKEFRNQAEDFDKCISKYYEYIDKEIGRLVERVGPNCNIIIASDHGFDFNGTDHGNCPDGIFIAKGPFIKKQNKIESISIYDILPTFLTLLGLPVAKDMKGKIKKEIINEDFLERHPIGYVSTYEKPQEKDKSIEDINKSVGDGIEQRLKALGYLD